MEDYRLEQTGQEVQDILNGAAMQSDVTTAVETLQGNIDAEETRAKAAEKQNADDIDAIEEKIPSGASSANKLATEDFVNDAVSTASATFQGTYNLVSDLHLSIDASYAQIANALGLEISGADNNDYCFVQVPTSAETPTEIAKIERYKFNGTAWAFEYDINNSGFTTAQWAAINSGISSGDVAKLSALPTNAQLTTLLNGKQDSLTFDSVPVQGSNNPVKSGGVYSSIDDEKGARLNADALLQQAIEAILVLIPSAATALNQLADKSFVNSSIATASATFRGTYNLVSDLHLTTDATHAQIAAALDTAISSEDNNDYAFVQIPTSDETPTEIAVTERYKFNGTTWVYEYDLNNSGFTAQQWEAINSAITSALVSKLAALPTNAELTTALAGKQAVLTFDNAPTQDSNNPVKSGGVYDVVAAINAKIPSSAAPENKLVDEDAMETYVTAIINAIDATYNLTSSDGHITLVVTQTNGAITDVQIAGTDIASASALTSLTGRVSTNEDDIADLQQLYNNLQQSAPVIVEPTDTWPVSNPSTTVIYRVVDRTNTPPQYYSDYMYNGTSFVLMAQYDNAIDDVPTAGSNNLVKSGGVAGVLNKELGFQKTSNTYSATEYYMLPNLSIAEGKAFKVRFNITGTFSRIILCANDDNLKRLIDSNDVTITDGKWFDIVAPYNITALGCYLSVGSGSSVGITLDVPGEINEEIAQVAEKLAETNANIDNLVGYQQSSVTASETDYGMMEDLNISQGQGFLVKFDVTGTFNRIILCANTENTIRLIDSNLTPVVGGQWYYVVAPVQISILGCWLSLPSGSSVKFDIKVLQETDGHNIKDESIGKEKLYPSYAIPSKKLIMQGNSASNTYKVKFRYSDTENMIILFERFGINNFLHPRYIYKETAQELTPNFTNNLTQYLYNGTDWVSPYAYCVATDYSPIENPFTVGGSHGTQGTSGFATMEVTSIDVYADGVKITDFSNLIYSDEIKIVTKSNVSACNRINLTTGEKETSFIETVVWTITENNIEVCTYLKAVEAIQIGAYVGLQMSEVYSSGEESVYFNDGHGKYYNNGAQHNSESLPFNGNRMVISKDGVDDVIVVYTNRAVGLGDLLNIGTSPVMYMASFGKCYAHLVQQSNPLVLGIGDVAYYSGGYTFAKTYSCPNAENAYFYKLNGKKVYCVDFLASGDSFVSVPEIKYGKQVEVVKNDNVTIDEIVSGNGIHVKSSGIGNVEFTIK